jgi:hypothetical protein
MGGVEEKMGPPGPSSSQYGSRYPMSRTYGPRDIIFLVIPRIGDNIVEYEALIIGLNLAIDKGVTHLKVIGDSDLIVSQVFLDFATKNERLKRYRDFARSIAKSFEVVSIEAVPREENYVVDALAVSASTLQPCDGPLQNLCKMEILFRPSIPDNFEHWQVFEDDDQILRFMENNREFTNS